MTVKINTKDGQIELSDDVIATVVGGSATEIFGVVGMASKSAIRDNFQALLGKENYAKGVVAVSYTHLMQLSMTKLRLNLKHINVSSFLKKLTLLNWKKLFLMKLVQL